MSEEHLIPILLKITSRTDDGEDSEPVSSVSPATLQVEGDRYIIRYTESMEDEETGREDRQQTRLEFTPGQLEMTRTGSFGTTMVYARGKRFEGIYSTPYGDLNIAVVTSALSQSLTPESGQARVRYQLFTQGTLASDMDLSLEYRVQAPC